VSLGAVVFRTDTPAIHCHNGSAQTADATGEHATCRIFENWAIVWPVDGKIRLEKLWNSRAETRFLHFKLILRNLVLMAKRSGG
jgi:hypothetical protein